MRWGSGPGSAPADRQGAWPGWWRRSRSAGSAAQL